MAEHDLINNVQVDSCSYIVQRAPDGMFVVVSWNWDTDAKLYVRCLDALSREEAIELVFGQEDLESEDEDEDD